MTNLTREQQIAALEKDWAENPRWKGIKRGFSAQSFSRAAACCSRVRFVMRTSVRVVKTGTEGLQSLASRLVAAVQHGKTYVL